MTAGGRTLAGGWALAGRRRLAATGMTATRVAARATAWRALTAAGAASDGGR